MKYCIYTLGCKVNKYESDSILNRLLLSGEEVTTKLEKADVYILNTCAVTNEAERKSRNVITKFKKLNPKAKIFVLGCASQVHPDMFIEKGVHYVAGTANKMKVIENLTKVKKRKPAVSVIPKEYEDTMISAQTLTRAYIKVQDGCDNFCSYCLIPYIRGRSRSRGIISILNEVGDLPSDIKEIVLVGINLTDYKIDGESALFKLLEELDKCGKRIRLSSIEESILTRKFLLQLKKIKNLCHHFHLSMQSGSTGVLSRMNRKYTSKEFLEVVKNIYDIFPKASITTDVIVGFPGETDDEFSETIKTIKAAEFLYMHIFPYSKREGTVAARMKQVNDDVKKSRAATLEKMNKSLMKKFISKQKNGVVIVEEFIDGYYVGHTANFVKCYIESKKDLLGQVVKVKIKAPYLDGAVAEL